MKRHPPARGAMTARPITPILADAGAEARHARHGYVGLEHLLTTLAGPDAPATNRLFAEHRITVDRAREAVWLVVGSGRGDGPRFDSTTLLATLGIDLDQIRRQVERRFGADAVQRLYASDVGWNLRPGGPLCELPMAPNLKRAVSNAIGACWDNAAPPRLHERLLLGALETNSAGLTAVLAELNVASAELHAEVAVSLRLAS